MAAAELRDNIVGLVRLIASSDQQRVYEIDVSIVRVPAELVCMWFDDLYQPDWNLFIDAFSQREQERLALFNRF